MSKWAAFRNTEPENGEAADGAPKPNPWVKLLDKNADLEEQSIERHAGPTTTLARSRYQIYQIHFLNFK